MKASMGPLGFSSTSFLVVATLSLLASTAPSASAQTYNVLYTFGFGIYGTGPVWGVLQDQAGNLYGSSTSGGVTNSGAVYELNTASQASVVYSFTSPAKNGSYPASLIRSATGNFIGNTYYGGPGGFGAVFALSASGAETILHSFTSGTDGAYPQSPIALDGKGNIFGMAFSYGGPSGDGIIFEITNKGKFSVLYSFTGGTDGGRPGAGLIQDFAGNLYGTTEAGGSNNWGAVIELSNTGKETTLYSFKSGSDGAIPAAPLIRDGQGNLYGTTTNGGTPGNCGTVFKVDETGTETVIFRFAVDSKNDGCNPNSGLIHDSEGNLYGTTYAGGTFDSGVIYEINTSGQETVLYTFTGGSDGGQPNPGLMIDSAGHLYGTTQYGGYAACGSVTDIFGCGVVFELTP